MIPMLLKHLGEYLMKKGRQADKKVSGGLTDVIESSLPEGTRTRLLGFSDKRSVQWKESIEAPQAPRCVPEQAEKRDASRRSNNM